jgi:hypothetical protein
MRGYTSKIILSIYDNVTQAVGLYHILTQNVCFNHDNLPSFLVTLLSVPLYYVYTGHTQTNRAVFIQSHY